MQGVERAAIQGVERQAMQGGKRGAMRGVMPLRLADRISVFDIDDFFACGIFHAPAVPFLGGVELFVVFVKGHLHPAGYEVEDEEVGIAAFVAAVRLQPRDDGGLLAVGTLIPEPLRRAKTVGELFVRLE